MISLAKSFLSYRSGLLGGGYAAMGPRVRQVFRMSVSVWNGHSVTSDRSQDQSNCTSAMYTVLGVGWQYL